MTARGFIITAGIYGAIAVLLGAMASHALKSILSESQLISFTTGSRYQMYHSIVLLAMAPALPFLKKSLINWIYYSFTLGILFFSGSIYLLSLGQIFNLNTTYLGPVTPIGGLMLITGWFLILVAAISKKD